MSTLLIDLVAQDNASKTLKGITADTRLLQGEIKNLDKEMKINGQTSDTLNQKMSKQNEVVNNYQTVLNRAKEKQKLLNDELKEAKTRLQIVGDETGGTGEEFEQCAKKVKDLEDKLERQNNTVRRAETDLKGARLEVEKTKKEMQEFANKGVKTAEEKLKDFTDATSKVGSSLKSIAGAFAPISAAATGALGVSAKAAIDFESQMSKVQAVSNASASEIELLNEKAKQMGRDTPKSATEAGQAFEYMALAGYDVNEMITTIEPMLQLSVAANLDLARTSDLVTDSMASLGVSADEASSYLDIVAATTANANTNAEDMMLAYIKAGGTFKNLNVPVEESAYWLGVLADQGYKGEQAGTSLNSIMINLTAGTKKVKTELERLGVTAFDANGNFVGMTDVLGQVGKALEGATEQQVNQTLAILGGKTQVAAMQKLIAGINGDYGQLKNAVDNATGALETQYDIMRNNVAGQFEELKSKLEGMAITIGDILIPYISQFVDWLGGLIDGFQNLSPGMQDFIVAGLAITAVIAPVLGILGSLVGTVASVATAFGVLGGATAVGGAIAAIGTFAAAAAPVVGIIAAIGGALWLGKEAIEGYTEQTERMNETIARNESGLRLLMDTNDIIAEQYAVALPESIQKSFTAFDTLYTNGLALASEFAHSVGTSDNELTTKMFENAQARTEMLLSEQQKRTDEELKVLEGFYQDASNTDKARIKDEMDRLKKANEEKKAEITSQGNAEKQLIINKDSWINKFMFENHATRQQAEEAYQTELALTQKKGSDKIEDILLGAESDFNVIREKGLAHRESITAKYAADEIKAANTLADEKIAAVNAEYEETINTLARMANDAPMEQKGMYQDMLSDAIEGRENQVKEIETMRDDTVKAVEDMAKKAGVSSKDMSKAMNDGINLDEAQKDIDKTKDKWDKLSQVKNINKTMTINVKTTGNTEAAKSAGISGFSLPQPVASTFGIVQPNIDGTAINSDISNFATSNSSASSVINNVARYERAVQAAAAIAAGTYTDNSKTDNNNYFTLNIDKMVANDEADLRTLVDRIDRELKKREQRAVNTRGGGNYVL